jgi:NitT/TauT family transport system substrate-binding protein
MTPMKPPRLLAAAATCLLLSACGGSVAAPPSAPASPVSASPAGSAAAGKAAASTSAASASAKPAASGAAAASAKPVASGAAASANPVASGAAGPAPSSQPITPAKAGTINLALVGGSPSATPLFVAAAEGLFEKYGVPTQVILMAAAPPAMAALLSGDVQIAMEGGALVGADTTADKLVFVGGMQNGFNQFVAYTKPSIKTLADLKGKTLAVGTPASAATIAFELMVKSAGLDPKNDVKWIYAGSPAAEWAALQNGQVDGATLVWPFDIQAKQAGFNLIGDGKEMKLSGASLTIGAQRAWVKSNGPVLQNFLKAVTEASSIANSDKAKTEAAVGKRLNVSDQTQLDAAFSRFAGTFPVPPYITKEAVQEAITDDPNPGNKQHKPEDYIENAPMDALVASGFTKQFAK